MAAIPTYETPTLKTACPPLPPCPVCGGLECLCRPRFFAGQLLSEEDLRALDHYIIEKNKLHNRYLHGWGVVCGLQVLCHECKGWVTIKSGYALDPCGNDIIVCEDYSFDLCAKIKECCDRKLKDWECEPMASPPSECEDLEQCWYVTLRYVERESRGITALKSAGSKACCDHCSCGSVSQQHCHCSCHNNGHEHTSVSSRATARQPLPQCEPTRICEEFKVEIAPAPSPQPDKLLFEMFEGTMWERWSKCGEAVDNIKSQRPGQSTQQSCCLYKKIVWDFLKGHEMTRCELLAKVGEQQCSSDPGAAAATMDYLDTLLEQFRRDCGCLALLPPCPGDPADPRVILACVRVQRTGGTCYILEICHWHGRRLVWTWPNVFYWLPVDRVVTQLIENACCNKEIPEPTPPPQLEADLAVTVGVTANEVNRTFNCTIVVNNGGPDTAQNVVLTATVTTNPAVAITPQSFSPPLDWKQTASSPFKASLEQLAAGGEQIFTFKIPLSPNEGTTLTLQGDVSSDTFESAFDKDNNHDTADATMPAVPAVPA